MLVRYGLIGYPLTHSFSPAYFTAKFQKEGIDAVYETFALPSITDFPSLINAYPDLRGLNVTIPYKQTIIPYLDRLSDTAKEIGAVNCIAIKDGRLTGYNTDATGFEKSLVPLLTPAHKRALVLGTGGSSLAVKYVLNELGIPFLSVSRQQKEDTVLYKALNESIIKDHLLVINTTPLGMFPDTAAFPDIPYRALTEAHLLYELVYNPGETKFLSLGKEHGATIKNGLEMLQLQADASWEIWS